MDFLRWLAEFRTPAFDVLFQAITGLAEEITVIVVLCWLYWCQNKKLAYTLGFSYFFSGLLVQGIKLICKVPRPWVLDPSFKPVESAVHGAGGFSFPSGHTQSGTALFSTLGFAIKKWWATIAAIVLTALVGFSRMYLGVHTPQDVLTSCALTLVISYFVSFHLQEEIAKPEKATFFSVLLFVICCVLTAYTTYIYIAYPEHTAMAKSSFKACGAGFGFAIGFYLERVKLSFELPETWKEKVIRFVVGLVSVGVLMGVFELTIKNFLVGNILSYVLLIVWVMAGYPCLFSKKRA